MQILRLDLDSALPLTVQLLTELFARIGRGLDERDLSAVGGRPRRPDRNAGELVSRTSRVEGDDGSPGLRRYNPDPASTHGKKAAEAKALELKGWPYTSHLAGRHFGLIVHGDSVSAEGIRRTMSDWLTDTRLISAGRSPNLRAMSATWSRTPRRIRRWTRTASLASE